MTDLLRFYAVESPWLAILHAALLALVVGVWLRDWRRMAAERVPLRNLGSEKLGDPGRSRVTVLASEQVEMVSRGQPVATMRAVDVYAEFFAGSEMVVQTTINGFLYLGLIGTLFNLWQLGPDFWRSLFGASRQYDARSLSFAFAASLFGIGWALAVSLLDSAACGRVRHRFADEVARAINRRVVQDTRNRVDLAMQEALSAFSASTRALLIELKQSVERVYADAASKSERAVTQVVGEIVTLRQESERVWQESARTVASKAEAVGVAANALGESIDRAAREVAAAEKQRTALADSLARLDALATSIDEVIRREIGGLGQLTAGAVEAVTSGFRQTSDATARSYADALDGISKDVQRSLETAVQAYREIGDDLRRAADRRLEQSVSAVLKQLEAGSEGFRRHLEYIEARLASIDKVVDRSATTLDEASRKVRIATEALAGRAAADKEVSERLGEMSRDLRAVRDRVNVVVRETKDGAPLAAGGPRIEAPSGNPIARPPLLRQQPPRSVSAGSGIGPTRVTIPVTDGSGHDTEDANPMVGGSISRSSTDKKAPERGLFSRAIRFLLGSK